MSILSINTTNEEVARTVCIELAREFGVRARHFKPATTQERRWLQEGIRPIEQFETIGNMISASICK